MIDIIQSHTSDATAQKRLMVGLERPMRVMRLAGAIDRATQVATTLMPLGGCSG
jgi:hypothetical protein